MKRNLAGTLYYITGILFAITAIINFTGNNTLLEITYICLSITFLALGAAYKKRKG